MNKRKITISNCVLKDLNFRLSLTKKFKIKFKIFALKNYPSYFCITFLCLPFTPFYPSPIVLYSNNDLFKRYPIILYIINDYTTTFYRLFYDIKCSLGFQLDKTNYWRELNENQLLAITITIKSISVGDTIDRMKLET